MPISSSGVPTAQRALHTLDGQETGCVHASDFAVVGDVDVTQQLKIDVSATATGKSVTLKTGANSADIILTLPSTSGTLSTGGGSGATTELDNLTTTAINKDLNFAVLRARSQYLGIGSGFISQTITFTLTPASGPVLTIPVTLLIGDDLPTNNVKTVAAFNAYPGFTSAGFLAYVEGTAGEWNYFAPSVYDHCYIKGPLGESFTLTNDGGGTYETNTVYDQVQLTAGPGNVTNVESITDPDGNVMLSLGGSSGLRVYKTVTIRNSNDTADLPLASAVSATAFLLGGNGTDITFYPNVGTPASAALAVSAGNSAGTLLLYGRIEASGLSDESSGDGPGSIKLTNAAGDGGVTLKGPTSTGSTAVTYILPETDGSAGQVLSTNGSGVLSWVDKN